MNVLPLALWTQVMDQRINFVVCVKVLNEPMHFLLSVSPRPSKELKESKDQK